MVVATQRPPRTAESEQPLPRWQVTIRKSSGERPEHFRRAPATVGVAEPVEPESADAPVVGPFIRDWIGFRLGGQSGVEGRVEDGHVGNIGQFRFGSRQGFQAGWIV